MSCLPGLVIISPKLYVLLQMVGRSLSGFETIIFLFIGSPAAFDEAAASSLTQQLASIPAQIVVVSLASEDELGSETSKTLELFCSQSKSTSMVYFDKFIAEDEADGNDYEWKLMEWVDEQSGSCNCQYTQVSLGIQPSSPSSNHREQLGDPQLLNLELGEQSIPYGQDSQKLGRRQVSNNRTPIRWASGTCRENSVDRFLCRSSTGMLRPWVPTYATLRNQYEEWNLNLKEAECLVAEALWERFLKQDLREGLILRRILFLRFYNDFNLNLKVHHLRVNVAGNSHCFSPRYRTRMALYTIMRKDTLSSAGVLRIMEDLRVPQSLILTWSNLELPNESIPAPLTTRRPFDMFAGPNGESEQLESPSYFGNGWEYWVDLNKSHLSLCTIVKPGARMVVRDEGLSRTFTVQVASEAGRKETLENGKGFDMVISTVLPNIRWWRSPWCAFLLGAASFLLFIVIDTVSAMIPDFSKVPSEKVPARRRQARTLYISSHNYSALYIQQLLNDMLELSSPPSPVGEEGQRFRVQGSCLTA